jgi:hypothetical protein
MIFQSSIAFLEKEKEKENISNSKTLHTPRLLHSETLARGAEVVNGPTGQREKQGTV